MTAKEMFKKLGFKYQYVSRTFGYVGHEYIGNYKGDGNARVMFFDYNQTYLVDGIGQIGIDLNKAIQKQIEELEW